METSYTFAEAKQLIDYHHRLQGLPLRTNQTPNLQWVEGVVQGFMALPLDRVTGRYEGYLTHYLIAPHKDEWLKTRRRESLRWLPFIIVAGLYLPLPSVLVHAGLWTEEWRAEPS